MSDTIVWEKVCMAISQPEVLLAEARSWVNELEINSEFLKGEYERLQKELGTVALERQWVITQARKGAISETNMDYQLGMLTLQELSLKQDLASVEQAVNIHLFEDWEERVREYLADLQVGIESLNYDPQGPEDEREIFEIKRQTVITLVRRVTIDRYRDLHVEIGLNIPKILNDDTLRRFEGTDQGEIETTGIHPGWRDDS